AAAAAASERQAIEQLQAFFCWFREHFPYYRGACGKCGADGHFLGLSRPSPEDQDRGGAAVAEIYRCATCNATTSFPRFRTVLPALRARRGRCGEYSWAALRLLEALGFPARWADNHAGHVWAEARVRGRWVHVDPCEAAVDDPLLYARDWGNCPDHVLAYQVDPAPASADAAGAAPAATVEDVTGRYRPADAEPVGKKVRRAVAAALARAQKDAAVQVAGECDPRGGCGKR
ncbi:unnamed protein product, partial [Prorocentrum cordatum]